MDQTVEQLKARDLFIQKRDALTEFPRMLFKSPGLERMDGGTFELLTVHSIEEKESALADGWFLTTADAKKAFTDSTDTAAKAAKEAAAAKAIADAQALLKDAKADEAAPTRAELEAKATELGITFSPNIGDKKLAEKIADKLAE